MKRQRLEIYINKIILNLRKGIEYIFYKKFENTETHTEIKLYES